VWAGKLQGYDERTVLSIQALRPEMQRLRQNLSAVGEERWNRGVTDRGIGKFLARELDVLPGSAPADVGQQAKTVLQMSPEFQQLQMQDRDLAYLTSEIITAEAMSTMALMSAAGVRGPQFAEEFRGHIEQALGNYGSIMINMATLDEQYLSVLRAHGITRDAQGNPLPQPGARTETKQPTTRDVDKEDDDFIKQFSRKKKQ